MAKLKATTYQPDVSLEFKQRYPQRLMGITNNEAPSDGSDKTRLENRKKTQLRGDILEKLHDVTTNPDVMAASVGPINKLQRVKILLNRSTSTMAKVEEPLPLSVTPSKTTWQNELDRQKTNPVMLARGTSTLTKDEGHPNGDGTTTFLKQRKESVDTPITAKSGRTVPTISNKVYLVNVSSSPYQKVIVQGLPAEIEYNPESTWSSVRSIGRNNPFYIFTGSEDTVSFEISWYADDENSREDVINKCKLLESWSKADGYVKAPPLIEIIWGNSKIFEGQSFILHSAKYKISNFQNSFRKKNSKDIVDARLLPNTASQSLVFKRVTSENLRSQSILSKEKINNTKGIS